MCTIPHNVSPQSTRAAASAVCTALGGPTPALLVVDVAAFTGCNEAQLSAAPQRLDVEHERARGRGAREHAVGAGPACLQARPVKSPLQD